MSRKENEAALPEKIRIWGDQIPYNTGGKKQDVLTVSKLPLVFRLKGAFHDIFGTGIAKNTVNLDTFAYKMWIRKGKESEFFDDIPTVRPFLTEQSDLAVIIAPGGGFCYKEMVNEGFDMARSMNERGISAFVLDYRVNPYGAPVGYLDMQRAIRYVRYHAKEFHISPDKIGVMGFSAGGYIAGAAALMLSDSVPEYECYTPDVVDKISCRPAFMALLYPVTGFDRNPSMLSVLERNDFFNPKKRPGLQKKYSLINYLTKDTPPQFVGYGTKDPLKDMIDYCDRAEEMGLPIKRLVIEGASHGFALVKDADDIWKEAFSKWCKNLFAE